MTRSNDISADVRRFVERRIDRIEQIEILLFVRRDTARFWTAADVGQALDLSERRVTDDLETLARRGLLDVRIGSEVVYRFSPATPALLQDVQRLAEVYADRRSDILAFVSRRRSLRDFFGGVSTDAP